MISILVALAVTGVILFAGSAALSAARHAWLQTGPTQEPSPRTRVSAIIFATCVALIALLILIVVWGAVL